MNSILCVVDVECSRLELNLTLSNNPPQQEDPCLHTAQYTNNNDKRQQLQPLQYCEQSREFKNLSGLTKPVPSQFCRLHEECEWNTLGSKLGGPA
jgi:hypothetical protein